MGGRHQKPKPPAWRPSVCGIELMPQTKTRLEVLLISCHVAIHKMNRASEMTSVGVIRQGCLQHEGKGSNKANSRPRLEFAQQSQYDHYDQDKADNS